MIVSYDKFAALGGDDFGFQNLVSITLYLSDIFPKTCIKPGHHLTLVPRSLLFHILSELVDELGQRGVEIGQSSFGIFSLDLALGVVGFVEYLFVGRGQKSCEKVV